MLMISATWKAYYMPTFSTKSASTRHEGDEREWYIVDSYTWRMATNVKQQIAVSKSSCLAATHGLQSYMLSYENF